MSLVVCLVTCPSQEVAISLAQTVVSEQLAACVNILPSTISIYSWNGELNRNEECLLVIKTARHVQERLIDRVVAIHPYETPEFVAINADTVLGAYEAWVLGSVLPPG